MREFATADVLFATRISAAEYAAARNLRWIHSSAVGVGGLLPPDVVGGGRRALQLTGRPQRSDRRARDCAGPWLAAAAAHGRQTSGRHAVGPGRAAAIGRS